MIDLSFSEMLLVAVIAIVVIGPKDLPRVMSQVGKWVGQGKAMMRQFRHGLDEMVRESELKDMEKRWAEHNQRIMAEHPDAIEDTPPDVDGQADGGAVEDRMQPLNPPPSPGSQGGIAPDDGPGGSPELPLDTVPVRDEPAPDRGDAQ